MVAAQFLMPGNVTERHGVLFEIMSDRDVDNLAGEVSYLVRNLDTGTGRTLTLPMGVMVPLYDRA